MLKQRLEVNNRFTRLAKRLGRTGMMHRLIYPLAVLLLVLGVASTAFASAEQIDSTLVIVLDPAGVSEPVDQSAKILVDSGTVTIFGVPDEDDGTMFPSDPTMFPLIELISVDSGAGNDKVSFEIVTTRDLDIAVDSTMGQAETKIKMTVPGAGPFSSNINLAFGNLEDKLELELDSQRHTNLNVSASTVSRGEKSIAVKAMYGSGTNVNNMFNLGLGAFEDETSIEIKSEADHLNNVFIVNSLAGEDSTKLVIEHLGGEPFNNVLALIHDGGEDGTDVIIKSPNASVGLSGMISAGGGVFGDDDKVNIEVDGGAGVDMTGLSITTGSGRDELNAAFKGSVDLSGLLTFSAGNGDDKLKLLVEGGLMGSATLDGGGGFDECEAFPGVMFIACEIEKQ